MPDGLCPSTAAIDLIGRLLVEKEYRLCTRRYELNDWTKRTFGNKTGIFATDKESQDYAGYFVYPNDASDIKNHPWFGGVPWDTLHLRCPPFVPRVKTWEDTKYFDEDEVISDIDSTNSNDEEPGGLEPDDRKEGKKDTSIKAKSQSSHHYPEAQHIVPSLAMKDHQTNIAQLIEEPSLANSYKRQPSPTLVSPHAEVDEPVSPVSTGARCVEQGLKEAVADQVPRRRRKEKKRPRDKILRDAECAATALEIRKSGSFLGYDYRRPKAVNDIIQEVILELHGDPRQAGKLTTFGRGSECVTGTRKLEEAKSVA